MPNLTFELLCQRLEFKFAIIGWWLKYEKFPGQSTNWGFDDFLNYFNELPLKSSSKKYESLHLATLAAMQKRADQLNDLHVLVRLYRCYRISGQPCLELEQKIKSWPAEFEELDNVYNISGFEDKISGILLEKLSRAAQEQFKKVFKACLYSYSSKNESTNELQSLLCKKLERSEGGTLADYQRALYEAAEYPDIRAILFNKMAKLI